VTLEIFEDTDRPRAKIYPLNTGLSFPPISTVFVEVLEVDDVHTNGLIKYLRISKPNAATDIDKISL